MEYPVPTEQRGIYPSLAGKRVLVTGGGSGIVAGFVRQGADVTFFDIAEADSRQLAERLGCRFERADLTDIAASQKRIAGLIAGHEYFVDAGWR